jgi:hypothetical protein
MNAPFGAPPHGFHFADMGRDMTDTTEPGRAASASNAVTLADNLPPDA